MRKCALALAVAVSATAGCATNNVDKSASAIANDYAVAQGQLKENTTMSARPSMLNENDGYYLLGEAKEVSAWKRLPARLKEKTAYNSPEPQTVTDILNRIGSKTGLRISISADAIAHLTTSGPIKNNPAPSSNPSDDYAEELSRLPFEIPGGLDDLTPEQRASLPAGFVAAVNMGDLGGGQPRTSMTLSNQTETPQRSEDVKLAVSYEGSLAGLLDHVTTRGDVFWEWTGDSVQVFRLKTVNYHLDVSDSSTTLETEMSSDRSSSDDAGGKSKTRQSVVSSFSSTNAFDELVDAVESMMNEDGHAKIAPSSGLLILTATPSVHARVSEYVNKVNELSNRQIALDVKIYEFSIENMSDYGIDWSGVFSGSDRVFATLGSSYVGSTPNMSLQVVNPTSRFVNSMTSISAENEDINFGIVSSSSGITKNGQPLSIQTANEVGFLEQMEAVSDEAGNVSYTLTPGSVLQGTTMTLLPKVLSDGSIDLRVAIDIAKINEIKEIVVGEGDNMSMIQAPDMESKDFVNIINANNGEPIMMTGMERTEQSASTNSLFSKGLWFLGGKKNGGTKKVMNMIVVTPFVVK